MVIESAAEALCSIAKAGGVQAAFRASILDFLPGVLESEISRVRDWGCKLLNGLVFHKSTSLVMLDVRLCLHLVSLLR
jgi:hypothetical protein